LGGGLFLIILFLLVVMFEVELNFFVISSPAFLIVFSFVFPDGSWNCNWPLVADLSFDSHPPPSGEEVTIVWVAVALDNLQDVVFVVVIGH
jgi:hypothetical protein